MYIYMGFGLFITSAKEVMFSVALVCLFVSLFVALFVCYSVKGTTDPDHDPDPGAF